MTGDLSTSDNKSKSSASAGRTILLAWLIAGTADLLTALFVYTTVLHKTTAAKILASIASGVFGQDAYSGGWPMLVCGVLLHYFIAFCFTVFYFLIYPYISRITRYRFFAGILYGAFVWLIMNLIVLKIALGHTSTLTPDAIAIGSGILMVCIGMPVSYIISRYYTSNHN